MKTIIVKAQPGKTFPLHATANPNGGFVLIKPGDELEVYLTTEVRRGLRDGDLVEVKQQPAATVAASSAK